MHTNKYITLQTETWEGNTYTVQWTYFSSFGWLNGSQWKKKKIKVTASQYTKKPIYKFIKWNEYVDIYSLISYIKNLRQDYKQQDSQII